MKTGRVLLVGVAGIVVLLLVAGGLALNDRFQTWAVRRALAGHPELGLTIGHVSGDLHHVAVRDVRMVRDGMVLTVPAADADLSVISAALRKQVFLESLVAKGWTLDLTAAPKASTPAAPVVQAPAAAREFSLLSSAHAAAPAVPAPAVFTGIFGALKFPVDLAVEKVDLAGEVIVPVSPGQPPARAKVTVTGGGLAAGKPGKFDFTSVASFAGGDVGVSTLTVRGTVGVVMDTPRTIARMVAATEAEAVGTKFPAGVKLTFDVSASRSTHGEIYGASITSGTKQLAALETSYPAGASHLGGSWRLDMRDTDLAPFLLGRPLPTFEAVGEGRFDTDTAFAEVRASGRLASSLDRLGVIKPQLAGLGAVRIKAEFDFAQRDAATRVDQLALLIEGDAPIATVNALQAFEFNLATGELNVADPSKELLGVTLHGVPLRWAAPLLAAQGLTLTGQDLKGEFSAGARNGGFALRAKSPLTIEHLSLSRTEQGPVLSDVNLSLTASGDYTPHGWQVEVAPFVVTSPAGALLSLEAKVGQLAGEAQPIKATGAWTGQLPALLAQPLIGSGASLTTGDAQGTLTASLSAKQEFEVRLSLKNLASGTTAYPVVTLDVRADREPTGKITFNAPLTLEREGRKSDLLCAGTLAVSPTGRAIDARLVSEFLAVEDAQILAGLLGGGPDTARAKSSSKSDLPPWSGISGQLTLALKKVVYNKQFQVTDIAGTLRIDAGSVKLANGRGGFDAESDMRLSGGVTFQPGSATPYSLAADFALNNFATGPAFQAINPGKPPTLEARITLASKLTGTGESLADLAARTRGDVLITSKGGLFRGLSADLSDKIQTTQSRVTSIASFLGVVNDDFVNKTKILSDIAKALSEIPFDQLSVTAVRDPALNMQLKDFTLISPEVRINGDGEIRYAEGVPVLAQPMTLQLRLGARGKLGDLIKRAGLLEAKEDNLGYAAFSVPLKIGGTAGNPDTSEIRNALLNSALQKSGLLDGLLGK